MKSILLVLTVGLAFNVLADEPRHVIELWPGGTPESRESIGSVSVVERSDVGGIRDRITTNISKPNLVAFPALSKSGHALLIVPGGGYQRVVLDKEGFDIAKWYQQRGVTCFVLTYRLPGEGWSNRSYVPLQDAQRALRIVRREAETYGYDSRRIGVMGFSAGGHLAASLATLHDLEVYALTDETDKISARPDFGIFIYPVISMDPAIAHPGSREKLIGPNPEERDERLHSVELNVSADTPRVFLVHATDDSSVPVENSIRLYRALQSTDVDVDLHIFAEGGHGFGLRKATDKPVAEWPELAWRWIQEN